MIDRAKYRQDYLNLIIKQYFYKPNARAEIQLAVDAGFNIAMLVENWKHDFDVDTAIGRQLDIVGKWVGMPRRIANFLAQYFFGFEGTRRAKGFADSTRDDGYGAIFYDELNPANTSQAHLMTDDEYRFFIKVKIALNNASAYIFNKDFGINMQEFFLKVFDGKVYLTDNNDMTMTVYIMANTQAERETLFGIDKLYELNLLPRPQGVKFDFILIGDRTFGFKDNPNAEGFFDDKNTTERGGVFAERLFF